MTVYISIGNSDDKLTQDEWARFYAVVDHTIREMTSYRDSNGLIGAWLSSPSSRYQNACWCAELRNPEAVKRRLRHFAKEFRQDSIAWAECSETLFLTPEVPS